MRKLRNPSDVLELCERGLLFSGESYLRCKKGKLFRFIKITNYMGKVGVVLSDENKNVDEYGPREFFAMGFETVDPSEIKTESWIEPA